MGNSKIIITFMIMCLTFFILSCTNKIISNDINNYELIVEGVGIANIVVGKSNNIEVIANYGDNFDLVTHKKFSCEMIYEKLSISFYYSYNDTTKTIFSIKIKAPYKGKTTKGICLGENTIKEVIDIYGTTEWNTSYGSDTWRIPYYGIEFHVEKDTTLPLFPLNKEKYLNKKIVQIVVRDPNKKLFTIFSTKPPNRKNIDK